MGSFNTWVIFQSGLSEQDYYEIESYKHKYYLSIRYVSFSQPVKDNDLERLFRSENPSAIILFLERDALENPEYRIWADFFNKQLSVRDDFRVFIHFHDLSAEEFNSLCNKHYMVNEGDPDYEICKLLYSIRDNIQINKKEDISMICGELIKFIGSLPRIRDQIIYRQLRIFMSIALGWAAFVLQIISAAFAGICSIIRIIFGSGFLVDKLSMIPVEYIAVTSAIIWCPTTAVVIYLLGRGIPFIGRFAKNHMSWIYILSAVEFLGLASTGIPGEVGAPFSWIAVGISAGIILDIMRRNMLMAKREQFALRKEKSTPIGSTLPKEVSKTADEFVPNPFSCPIFPDDRAKVFISYTHSSQWAHDVADDLYKELKRVGADCFLDQHGISLGSSWRRRLNQKMVDANAFICVADKLSITKAWPAAEMETALKGRHLTGLPEIIVLTEPELSANSKNTMPVFKAVFAATARHSEEDIRIIEVKENNLRTIASGFRSASFKTGAVLPPLTSIFLNMLQMIPGSLGPFGTIAGFLLLVGGILNRWKAINLDAWLGNGNLLNVVFVLSCFWLGFTVKLTLATRYEVNVDNPSGSIKINILAIIGFLYLIYSFVHQIPALLIGWSAVLCITGFYSAGAFIYNVSKAKQDFLKIDI